MMRSVPQSSRTTGGPRRAAALLLAWLGLAFAAGAPADEVRLLRVIVPGADEAHAFSDIAGLALAPDGTPWFSDGASGRLFRAPGESLEAFAAGGKPRLFGGPLLGGVARLADDSWALARPSEDRIAVVDAKGTLRLAVGQGGSEEGRLSGPAGLAASARGRLYVADRGNRRVSVYTHEGLYLFSFGDAPGADALQKPVQVAVDGEERVYVLDAGDRGRALVYDAAGGLLRRIAARDLRLGERAEITALAVDSRGRLLLAERGYGKLVDYDWQAGKVLQAFGSRGAGRGQFAEVTALALADDGTLAVGDRGNRKLELYQLPAPASTAVSPLDALRLPTVRALATQSLDCDRAWALPDGTALCANDKTGNVARLDAGGKPLATLAGARKPRFATADARDIALVDGDEVKVFGYDGRLRFAIGGSGSGDGQFDAPAAVALGKHLVVADSGNRRLQVFSRDGVFLDKLADPPDREWLRRPEALALDAQGNFYVGDNALKRVRVFSARHEHLYDLGADDRSPQRFERIEALALDADDQLIVLAATAVNAASVQVWSGPKRVFRFGAALEAPPGFARATSLALLPGAKPALAVFDAGQRALETFAWLPVPSRAGGLAVQGDTREARLRWQRAPGSTVSQYRIYGAAAAEGPYALLKETSDTAFTLSRATAPQPVYFRVSAVSSHGVEGPASRPREDLFRSGLDHYEAGRYAEAAARFAQAWKDDPQHAAALEYLGRSLAAQGRHDEALRHFRELARLDGRAVRGANLEAETLLATRDPAAARAVLEPLVIARGGDADTYYLCGQAALALGDNVTASDCLEQSVKRNRDSAAAHFELGRVYLRLGAANNGFGEIDAATALAPQDAALWRRAGAAYQKAGRAKEALERYQRALALDGADAEARLGAARAHIALKEYDKARAIAQSLVGGQDEAAGQYLLGTIALALKDAQGAVLALGKAASRDPRNATVWLALAEAQGALKNDAKAREALKQAATADPAAFEAYYRLGLLEQANREPAAAAAALEKAVALQPGHYDAQLALATALLALEHHRDAAEHAREAARLAPKRIEPLLLFADAARAQGKYGEAIEALKKAVALASDAPTTQLKLGQAYLETRDYEPAQAQLERAALLEPKNPVPHDLLGQMYLERRLFDPAIREYTRAAELGGAEYRAHLDTAYATKKKALEFGQNSPRLVLQDLRVERVFSAAYKRYAQQPVGSVKVVNLGGTDYKNLKLSFHIKGYMDFPQTQEIALLPAGDSVTLPLHALFNNKILGVDEDTGVQVEVKLGYFQDGQPGSIELTRPMTLYGKNAIQWADFRTVGAFVTPRDDVLKDFVRQSLTQYLPQARLDRKLLQAMTLFDVLAAHGLRYQADPNTPYSKVSGEQVDYVQFPRETLRLRSGDCDDLSVLLAAALENLGIETALVDVPGHLFLLFDTGVPAAERDRISLQDDLLVIRDGEVWLPLESTLIATSFAESWTEGARKFQEGLKAGNLRVVPLKDAWTQSQPVTLAPAREGIAVPAPDKVQPLIERERRILVTKSIERLVAPYRAMLVLNPSDATAQLQIAILYAQNGLNDLAFREFDRLLAIDPRSAEAHNDRGNIYYNSGDYDRALEAYSYAEELDPADGGIKLNLALVHYKRGRLKEAAEKYREAVSLNKALAGQYPAFGKLLAN